MRGPRHHHDLQIGPVPEEPARADGRAVDVQRPLASPEDEHGPAMLVEAELAARLLGQRLPLPGDAQDLVSNRVPRHDLPDGAGP